MLQENAWLTVWAKSDRDLINGECVDWLPLHQHLDDTAAVAGQLIDHWVSPQVLDRIAQDLPDGVAGVRTLACWLAAVHDVGKASPAFVVQVPKLADHMRNFGLDANPMLANDPQRGAVNHALVGHVAVRDWLADELKFDFDGVASQLGSIVGSHHGVTPEDTQLALAEGRVDLAGSGPWSRVRTHFLDRAAAQVGGRAVLSRYANVDLSKPSQALLTAIVIVADWIASNPDLFPLRPISTLHEPPPEPSDTLTSSRLDHGWATLALPSQWEPRPIDNDLNAVFRARFDRPDGAARPVQVAAVETALAQSEPGMIIIEAPMGSGKTEAALMAAEVLAHASGANGCFIALPTQATTDAMFTRVRSWLNRLPGSASTSISLAHGKANLNDEYTGLVRTGKFTSVGDGDSDSGAVIAHEWLSGRKKSGLASFVVGTIDQVLFASLKSRHLMLRHLALAGKVVIIDEVHAYDVYMSQYLHRVLHWLGAYRVPVVLLSATLPDHRRAELLHAYDSGRGTTVLAPQEHPGYPVVCGSGGMPPRSVDLPADRTTVKIDRLADDLDTLVNYLRKHLADGGCAVVVRNTVGRVQETAERLIAEFGDAAVTINHSRFLACDRAKIDQGLVTRFGPQGNGSERPALHIVVASQVVEQSLDIDFDLMITDLAPIDLVLQRMGRLHRHDRDRPDAVKQARVALVGIEDWAVAPIMATKGSRRVYGEHMLFRSAALLAERDEIVLPHDIAPLVQSAYGGETLGPQAWQMAMTKAELSAKASARKRTANARNFLLSEALAAGTLIGWLRAGVGDTNDDTARSAAQVRDGAESLEVLVVQRDKDGGLLVPDWIPGGDTQIPLGHELPWKLARTISACSLRLPLALSHGGIIDAVILELERNSPKFDQTRMLKGQLFLVLDGDRKTTLHGFRLTYDPRRGLIHEAA
jgi:CRISPR-associated helicase Cas3/CRISPR-associated endonuclease Cas3-HD